ncbi:alpha/beta hydrolase family protein [Eilatimonas milleporae]|uniref:Peptidase S9 prolyl oligopeptidase catalytic domain-containing protein n=1 Tax=Eilatimonas milleporae TaxID=911205 RepID=A0A3M0CIZ0_9PROT|nr:prolyl oligopeptidase family serine peptidase [Eilatimonas milleporae]RMB08737.1 hypothetical protein BXY39_1376 [Eilatimonas milleporae]
MTDVTVGRIMAIIAVVSVVFIGTSSAHAQKDAPKDPPEDFPSDFTEERVVIDAGDISLGASLYRPRSVSGDVPLMVIGHGSAPTDRTGVGFYTHNALNMGVAVLSFDKRGIGVSTGEYVRFSVDGSIDLFDALANDMVAAVEWAATRPGIDAARIGLFGGSQAGWIMPLAASRTDLVKFIVIGEGTPVSAGEEAVHGETIRRYRGSEFDNSVTPAEIAQADAALEAFTGENGFDPLPVLKSLDIPILWLFGLRDAVIPVTPSLSRLERLTAAGRGNHTVFVFPFGDHNFRNVATGRRYDIQRPIMTWMIENGFAPSGDGHAVE